jgi:lysophospholipase L1-like esterase
MSFGSPKLRIGTAALLAVVTLVASNCSKLGGGGSPTAPSGPPSPGSTIVYTAVGASDVTGTGSTRPCLPFEDCNGNGYVWIAARQLRSLGYTVIDKTSTLVTIFAGVNEIDNAIMAALGGGAGGTNPAAYIDAQANSWANDFATLVSGVRWRVPQARIIALNVPNVGALPSEARDSIDQKRVAQRAAIRMTAAVNGTSAITVIDMMCDARFYQPGFFSSDGLHPNDAGYAVLGAEVALAVTSPSYPAPKTSCPQMTLF